MSNNSQPVPLNRDDILDIVVSSLKDNLEMVNSEIERDTVSAETRLVGHNAVLDSMGLVSLILDIEQQVNEEYDVLIILADERAMSQKQSPFRSVATLSDYICQLVTEQTASA